MNRAASPNSAPALSFSAVGKRFKTGTGYLEALQAVSFSISSGVAALIGPDGAGKTTLLRLAAGLLLPDEGSIDSFGVATSSPESRQTTGYMPQRFGLYEDLTVLENLNLYADLYGIDRSERKHRFDELMHMTGMAPFYGRLASRLSGGMKQKLGLACTLVNRPKLLLLDEPSVGVDPVSRRELWQIIATLVKDHGTRVLLSTAYMDEAEHCDWVILLEQGRIVRQGSPDEFRSLARDLGFLLSSPVLSKRAIQQRLAGHAEVVDAVVQGDAVRAVMKPGWRQDWPALFGSAAQLQWQPVAPRLEDAFILLMQERRGPRPATETVCLLPDAGRAGHFRPAVIEVDEVDRWFDGFQAVKKLSFSVRHGEIFGLLGANGAGKTTTFRMLCGLLPASNGRLRVAGVDLRSAAAKARSRLGYMSQKFSLYGHLSVRQNLEFFSHAYGLRNRRRLERIDWALAEFDLHDFADTNSSELPLGFKQRLALACALMHEPEILFLDEPTSGIDPLARREFWTRINQLAALGVTVLVTTHFMEEAEYCDRLLIMREGDILATGTPVEIKRRGQSPRLPPAETMEEVFIRLVEARAEAGP